MLQVVIAPIANVRPAVQQLCLNETLRAHGQTTRIRRTLDPAIAAGARRLRDRKNTITAITEQRRTIRTTARRMTTGKPLSSIAQDHGVTKTIHTRPPAAGRLRLPLIRRLPAAPIVAEQVRAQMVDPGAETKI